MISPIQPSIHPPSLRDRRNFPKLKIDSKMVKDYFKNIDPYYIYYYHDYSPILADKLVKIDLGKFQQFIRIKNQKWLNK